MRLLPLLYKLRIDLSNGNIERSLTPTIHRKGETVYQKKKTGTITNIFYTHKDINLSIISSLSISNTPSLSLYLDTPLYRF